jgi:hypothetical protein
MTRKDYVRIARALELSSPIVNHSSDLKAGWAWMTAVEHIVLELQGDNPRFDKERFLTACNYYNVRENVAYITDNIYINA